MAKTLLSLLIVLLALSATAQEAIVNQATLLIAEGKYKDAESYLDSILHAEPKNVTALMMKGNVLLNYALIETPALHIISAEDESILSPDLAGLKDNVTVVPRAAAARIARLWLEGIAIDSSRLDLRKGLCSLYGMALMRDELMAYLPVMKEHTREMGGSFAYTLADYARLLHERGDTAGAYRVYHRIIELYPAEHGLNCTLASLYFSAGDVSHALGYSKRGLSTATMDRDACADAREIFTLLAPIEIVPDMLEADTSYGDHFFYSGLLKFSKHDDGWKKDMNRYLGKFQVAADSNQVFEAALYLATDPEADTYNGLMSLLTYRIGDYGARLVTTRLRHDFADSTLPYIIEAQILINDKRYNDAASLLAGFMNSHTASADMQEYYAYALYQSGDHKKSIAAWAKYIELQKQAGNTSDSILAVPYYYTARAYWLSGDKTKAGDYFGKILAGKDDSKYAYLAKLSLDALKK
ncbi:MAG: tetratricopeptide repeat protein [Bacteroidetes bacterium]|nr:tetratricopeptide repeat protein [Bacteroidota bacterium]